VVGRPLPAGIRSWDATTVFEPFRRALRELGYVKARLHVAHAAG